MKTKLANRILSFVLALCMAAACLFVADAGTIQAEAANTGSTIYFLDSEGWGNVGAYIYGDQGELLGGWGTTTAVAAEDLGGSWLKVDVSGGTPPFSIIFYNKANDSQRAELYLPNADSVYVTADAMAYTSQSAAENAINATPTTVYFLNWDGEKTLFTAPTAYVWSSEGAGEAAGGWPGLAAKPASNLGGNWWVVEIPANASVTPFNVIFSDNGANQITDVHLTSYTGNYITAKGDGTAYTSQSAAEASVNGSGSGSDSDPAVNTTVYFLNSAGWTNVGAYAYNTTPAEALGSWGTSFAEAAPELGSSWMKIDVPAAAPFNIIFYNTAAESERAELQIPSADSVYVTVASQSYTSQSAAENAMNATPTTVYFLNWDGEKAPFTAPTAYVWSSEGAGEAAGGWPGLAAEPASNLGDNWWVVEIPANATNTPFNVIFNDNGANQIADVHLTSYTGNYITAKGDGTAYTTQSAAETSVGIVSETVVYYLNSEGWENIGAYVYGSCGEALGSWPGADAEAASELGDNWVKVTVPAKAPFSIIFFDKADPDPERAELYLASDKQVYVAGCKTHSAAAAYGSQLEAELAMGIADPSLMTTLYFYNSRGWGDIYGYVFREEDGVDITIGAGWPGTACETADEIGENWWKIAIPRTPTEDDPFYVVFNDGINQTQEDILIDDTENIYVTVTCKTFPTPEEAEAEAANDDYDDGCEDGPNADIENYSVSYSGAGAALPYVTYEAENAKTNAKVLEEDTVYRSSIQSEASGRQAVELSDNGDYVEFTLTKAANSLVLRYSMPDNASGTGIDATLSLYISGKDAGDLDLTSKYAWVYGGYPYDNNPSNGNAHRFFDETRLMLDETLPAGTTIRLQKDSGDSAEYYVIDFIECEQVGAPLTQPEGSLSVTDFGAVANDGKDDREAFEAAIAAAKEQDAEVWIPAGTFDLVEEESLVVSGVTIRGAGMWYTTLCGAGAAFKYEGTSKFFDFAMTGVSTVRDDSGDLAGFEGTGSHATNVTIQNIWMEHMKVGVWSANTERLAIQGCRIRNTYADGINLCSGTHDSVVRNNSMRNTGDDAIAIWPWLGDCSGNTISHNTIQVPTLANGVAVYGGGSNTVDSNHVSDTINNGAGIVIGSEFDTAKGYTGNITVKNNVLDRCGSMQSDESYPIGAIWIWSSWHPMTTGYNVYNNVMNDCVQEGILIECNSELTGLSLVGNTINGATNGIYEYLNGNGTGTLSELTVSGLTGEEHVDDAPNFILTVEAEHVHSYGEAQYSWSDDNQKLSVTIGCAECGDILTDEADSVSVTVDATCIANGKTIYTATVTLNGTEYTNSKTVTLPMIDHADKDSNGVCDTCGKEMPKDEPEVIETICIYRLYNPNSGEHFYTGSEEERDDLIAVGWSYEGIAWNAPVYSGDPVYRVYNPNSGDHHYTTSSEERDDLIAVGWNYEGVAWNSASNNGEPWENTALQFRLYNPNADLGNHHYTGSEEERDNLTALGWEYEGICWYGLLY